MPGPFSFEYAVLRVVPRVERGESVNAGVILYCKALEFLEARISLDSAKLRAIDPDADLPLITTHLDAFARICTGGADAGPIGALTQAERFRWLVAPRSTMIQPSAVHEGLCDDPHTALERVLAQLGLAGKGLA